MQNLLIRNGRVLMPDGKLTDHQLLIEQGRIAAIGETISRAVPELDAAGAYVIPGLIDIHVHGIKHDSTETSLVAFASEEARHGATTFVPTFFGPPEHTAELMRRYRAATDELRQLPQVAGFRLESPYLARAGGGNKDDLVPITDQTTNLLLEAAGGHIKIWDVSPELDHAPGLVRQLSKAGIVCSLAHTTATIAQARAAVDAGARMVTHLFDAFVMPEMHESGVYPAGLTDYLLLEDRVACEIIPDGTHVPPLLVEKALRCKPANRLIFITDGNSGAGLPSGEYDLPRRGRVRIDGANHGVRRVDRDDCLCGSALTPIDCFRNAIKMFGQDLATATRVCSTNPAELLKLNKGLLAPGRDGDVLILNPDLEILYTITAGTVMYRR